MTKIDKNAIMIYVRRGCIKLTKPKKNPVKMTNCINSYNFASWLKMNFDDREKIDGFALSFCNEDGEWSTRQPATLTPV